MSQNSLRLNWTREEVDSRLRGIMKAIHEQCVFASAVGAVFACARARDDSIWLPIAVHAGFDFVAFAAAGSIGGALEDSPATVIRLLVPGLLIWFWAAWLIWRAPRHELAAAPA
jgi:hypothetical protein